MKPQKFSLPDQDPFATLDMEIKRLSSFFGSLGSQGWNAPTRCEGWTVRDMVAHFDSDEEYNEACLNDTVEVLIADFTNLDDFNNRQIQKRSQRSNAEILQRWRDRQTRVRKAWEEMGLTMKIPTFVGPYPLHAQIWHITSEYATHTDDMDIQVPPADRHARLMWRFQFSAFAVQEKKRPPGLKREGDRMTIFTKKHHISLTAADFVSAVSGRLPIPKNPQNRQIVATLRTLA